jgi:hypothetical protein
MVVSFCDLCSPVSVLLSVFGPAPKFRFALSSCICSGARNYAVFFVGLSPHRSVSVPVSGLCLPPFPTWTLFSAAANLSFSWLLVFRLALLPCALLDSFRPKAG